MKKAIMMMAGAVVCAGIFTGCNSTPANQVKAEYEKFQNDRPGVEIVETGNAELDNTAALAANIYGKTVKYLDEYVAATDNHRAILGFQNEVLEEIEKNKMSKEEAYEIVSKKIKEADETKPADEKVMPKVVAGLEAVENLKPVNKLKELAPLAVEAAKVAANAQALAKSFTGISPDMLKKARSAAKVAEQSYFSSEAIAFLIRQYQCVQDSKNYMQK